MKITNVDVYLNESGALRGFANVTFDDCFVVKGLRILNGSKGEFVSMPSTQGKDGEYYDTAFPLTKEFREELTDTVLDAFDAKKAAEDRPRRRNK